MTVGLFIPCYVNQFYPNVAIATLQLLEKLGCSVHYPMDQTCCGQPLANSGYELGSLATCTHFVDQFKSFDYIVCPSGSCTLHVKHHYDILQQTSEVKHVREHVFELTEFLLDVLKINSLNTSFPHKVGFHSSCHGQRGLRLSSSTELNETPYNKAKHLLNMVKGIQLTDLSRGDECCGFGGTFAIKEEALSVKMGNDRIQDHLTHGAEFITGGDMSCLMHMEGLIMRQKLPVKIIHLAEILNGSAS